MKYILANNILQDCSVLQHFDNLTLMQSMVILEETLRRARQYMWYEPNTPIPLFRLW